MDDLMRKPDANEPELDSALFPDCVVVPAQFYPHRRGAAETQPLKRLMTAMLVDAVQCFQAGESQRIEKVSEALTWIFGRYADLPFFICERIRRIRRISYRIRRRLLQVGIRPSRGSSGDRKKRPFSGRRASPPFHPGSADGLPSVR